jgi:hypothetical protein
MLFSREQMLRPGVEWVKVVDCRRILKWTYAYGYYRFSENATSASGAAIPAEALKQQQDFFEFNQV